MSFLQTNFLLNCSNRKVEMCKNYNGTQNIENIKSLVIMILSKGSSGFSDV